MAPAWFSVIPVMQNSSSAARQIAALIQCHECIVRYSCILRREFTGTCRHAKRAQTLHENYSYLQGTLIYGRQSASGASIASGGGCLMMTLGKAGGLNRLRFFF